MADLFCCVICTPIPLIIRVNRDVSITLYCDRRIGFDYADPERVARLDFAAEESAKEVVPFPTYRVKFAR